MYFILILTTGLIVGFAAGYLVKKKTVSVRIVQKEIFSREHSFSTDFLELYTGKTNSGNIPKNSKIIKKTLHDHGIEVIMGDVNIGPTLTQYTLKPAEGVKLNEITDLWADLSLALAAHPIRIEAPIPGKNLVGIEIPNKITAIVGLREILESEEFKSSKSNLTLPLGRDVSGIPVVADLKETPNILMSGATGSGKSVLINDIILSLIYQNNPEDVRLILDDAKRVEFPYYSNIPHLLTPVIYDSDKTKAMFCWALEEARRRSYVLNNKKQKDIESYNQNVAKNTLPHIIIIIDEFSDRMAVYDKEIEAAIVELAKVSRTVGIHLIIATSRPSHDVLTNKIKNSIPCRIGLATASDIDSLTIIDVRGAEKLFGRGDILFGNKKNGFKRIQVPLVTDKEIDKVTDYLKNESPPSTSDQLIDLSSKDRSDLEDDFYDEAKKIVEEKGLATAPLLQRYLKIGYARASKLLDMLETNHIIGPEDGPRPRKVLIKSMAKEVNTKKKK